MEEKKKKTRKQLLLERFSYKIPFFKGIRLFHLH